MTSTETRRSRAKIQDVREQRNAATPFELRKAKTGDYVLEGYASTWEAYDCYGGVENGGWVEQLHRRAFDVSLASNPDLQLLINHEGMPLARTKSGTLELSTDRVGLKVRAYLDPRDPDVQALLPKMERGDLDEMSFAFRVKDQEWNNDFTHRMIREASLQKGDVSVVNYGMNPTTKASILVPSAVEALSHVSDYEMAELRKLPNEELDNAMKAILRARGIDPGDVDPKTIARTLAETRAKEARVASIVGVSMRGSQATVELSNGTVLHSSVEFAQKASAEMAAAAPAMEARGNGTPTPPGKTQDDDDEDEDDDKDELGNVKPHVATDLLASGPGARSACAECVDGLTCPYCGRDNRNGGDVSDMERALAEEDEDDDEQDGKPRADDDDKPGESADEDEEGEKGASAQSDKKPPADDDDKRVEDDDEDDDEDKKPPFAERTFGDQDPDDPKTDEDDEDDDERTIGDQDPKDPSKDDEDDGEDDEDEDERGIPYADPGYIDGVKRCRLDTESNAREALKYVNANARHYTTAQFQEVKRKVRTALSRFGVSTDGDEQLSTDIDHVELRGKNLSPVFIMKDGSEMAVSVETWDLWSAMRNADELADASRSLRTIGDQDPKDPSKDDDDKDDKDEEKSAANEDHPDDCNCEECLEGRGENPFASDDDDQNEDDEDEDEEDTRKRNFSVKRAMTDLLLQDPTVSLADAMRGLAGETDHRIDKFDPPKAPAPKPEPTVPHQLDEAYAELRGGEAPLVLDHAELLTAQEIKTPDVVERLINPPPPPEPEPEPEPEPTHQLDEAYAELRGGEDPYALDRAMAAAQSEDITPPEAVQRLLNPEPKPVEPEEIHVPVNVRSALDEFLAEDRKRYSLTDAAAAASSLLDPERNAPTTTDVERGWGIMDDAEKPFLHRGS